MGVEPHKVRRSTLVLVVVFVAALVSYLIVRPEPLPPEYVAVVPRRSVPAVTVPLTTAPTTTRVVERPVSTTTATTQVVDTTTTIADTSTPDVSTSVPDTSALRAPTTTSG